MKEELDELAVDEDVRTEGEEGGQTESNEGTKTGAGHGGTPTTDGSPTPTPMEEDTRQLVRGSTESELGRVLEALTPLDGARFRRGRWHVRLYLIAQVGPVRVGTPWDKSPPPSIPLAQLIVIINQPLSSKIPSLFLLRLTIPSASQPWSKPLATLHAFLAPLVFCFAFQCPPLLPPPFQSFSLSLRFPISARQFPAHFGRNCAGVFPVVLFARPRVHST